MTLKLLPPHSGSLAGASLPLVDFTLRSFRKQQLENSMAASEPRSVTRLLAAGHGTVSDRIAGRSPSNNLMSCESD